MKINQRTKKIAFASTSAVALLVVGLLNAQDEVNRPAFYTNDVRLHRPVTTPTTNIDETSREKTATPDTTKTADMEPLQAGQAESQLPPVGVKVGECYAQVLVEAEMVPVQERMMVKEESFQLVEIPAEFEQVEEKVMVKAGYERQEVIPATYKTVEEKVLKQPAYTRQVPVAPVYETRTEKVLVKPERTYWTEGKNPVSDLKNPTSEIMCLVREPAEYKEISRQVLVSAASYREEKVPAEYETYTRTVIDQPATVRTIKVPAEYETRMVRKVKTPARTEREMIPAQYATVDRIESRGESRIEWRRVLCETNATPEVVADIQTKLNERGYDVKVNGELDRKTRKAINDFQNKNDLPIAGVSYASLDALGVNY